MNELLCVLSAGCTIFGFGTAIAFSDILESDGKVSVLAFFFLFGSLALIVFALIKLGIL